MEYKISKNFGKGIVDGDGIQVAWVDDYVMAKAVCMFLNDGYSSGLYPKYVSIGGSCYVYRGDVYYSHRLGVSLDFTVDGDRMYSVSSMEMSDRLLIIECGEDVWMVENGEYL
jgi:hypothetical protein